MKTTINLEIPVVVSFEAENGYPPTRTDPGYPDELSDITYDPKQVTKEVDKMLYGKNSGIDEVLWEAVEEDRKLHEKEGD